jgi:putative pyruvate formate lyase activating enzyme
MDSAYPSYLKLFENGSLCKRVATAKKILTDCRVCPRNCRVNRVQGEMGECQTGINPIVSSYFPHFGEETPLVGSHGSGTIFICGCNLRCLFCQNYDISHQVLGKSTSIERFAGMMLELQDIGCHNINIITPSHIVPQLIEAIFIAVEDGLKLPIVYNSSGYDSLSSLKLLEGVIDIYLPDFKFFSDSLAQRYTAVADYGTVAKAALREMHRQVGDLQIDGGIARRGMLIRHLVMPGMLEDSRKIFEFISREISPDTYLNVMPQYRPAGEAGNYPEIGRSLNYAEFLQAVQMARDAGLQRLDKVV